MTFQSADGDKWPRDHTPPLIHSLVLYAGAPAAFTSGSAEKQSQRGAVPLCVASRFQLTQFGPPWLAMYESVYWRREMMMSSLVAASVGVPSAVLCPSRAVGEIGRTSAVTLAVPIAPSLFAVAVMIAWPALMPVSRPLFSSTEMMSGADDDHVTSLFVTVLP